METRKSELLAAIDRRLWRDLGFADPEPEILPLLPMLVVGWADGTLGEAERERIEAVGKDLSEPVRAWLAERLRNPPGPYFRYQVGHLLAFLVSVWPREREEDWAGRSTALASELVHDAGWLRRIFGGVSAERRRYEEIRAQLEEQRIAPSDRIWSLARGRYAECSPRNVAVVLEEDEQAWQARAITLDDPSERIGVASVSPLLRDEDLDAEEVTELLARGGHLREAERWILLAERLHARGRPITPRQHQVLSAQLAEAVGHPCEEVPFAEQAYLEDALATDAHWMSWLPGRVEELRVDHERVVRAECPGSFDAPRAQTRAHVAQQPVPGPDGLGFRVLHIDAGEAHLRLASPVIVREPASREAVAWLARFLPAMCDPCTQLVMDEDDGPRWVAEVHSSLPTRATTSCEPLLAGRSLLVPPWVWFRAAHALNVRFFSGKRRSAS